MGVDIIRGRQTISTLTNKTGGGVVLGDVVIIADADANAFVSTAVEGQSDECVGVVLDTISNNDTGRVLTHGYTPQINLDGAAALRDFVETDGVALQGTPVAAPEEGVFAQVLEAGTTPAAIIWPFPMQPAGGGALYESYYVAWDQKAQGVWGGGFTQGAWRTRDLNQEVDPDGIAALAGNQITLDAGTYRVFGSAPAYTVAVHQTRLYNVTDAALLLTGTNETSEIDTARTGTRSFVSGRFTVGAAKAIELQHWCRTTVAINGLGDDTNWGVEIYSTIEFWKEA